MSLHENLISGTIPCCSRYLEQSVSTSGCIIGKAIELVPGKSEEYLLLEFEDNCRLWLRGSKSFGKVVVTD